MVAVSYARAYLTRAEAAVGHSRGQLIENFDEVPVAARDRKIALGLRKLVEDRCEFSESTELDPVEVRRVVFGRAAAIRQQISPGGGFDRMRVLEDASAQFGTTAGELEGALYADLKRAHLVTHFEGIDAADLVDLYEVSQAQAVLLRATRVEARVRASNPAYYRMLFRTLKFRRLLFEIHPEPDGYRIIIDGPMSLFSSGTKYGLALALSLPAIQSGTQWSIDAELLWGPARERLGFHQSGQSRARGPGERSQQPTEVEQLVERWPRLESRWQVSTTTEVLNLPGVGLTVPDLAFSNVDTGEVIYFEVLGFWSRDAVWKRVELVEAGLGARVLFAVSSSLRVSETVLPEDASSMIYVFRQSLRPKAVLEHLEALSSRRLDDAAPRVDTLLPVE